MSDTTRVNQSMKTLKAESMLLALSNNLDKNFVQRIVNASDYSTIKNPDGTTSSHLMRNEIVGGKYIVFPEIVQDKNTGKLFKPTNPVDYALEHNEFIEFRTMEEAGEFAKNGYKKFFNIAKRSNNEFK